MRRTDFVAAVDPIPVAIAVYACSLSFSSAGAIAGCMNCVGDCRRDIYERAPVALAVLTLLAWRLGPTRMARAALATSAGLWIAAVGLARGWW